MERGVNRKEWWKAEPRQTNDKSGIQPTSRRTATKTGANAECLDQPRTRPSQVNNEKTCKKNFGWEE